MTRKRLSLLIAVALSGIQATGCVVAVDEEVIQSSSSLGDLEVRWSIDGDESSALCDSLGIQRWEIEVRGREDRDVRLDCRDHWWSSETDFFSLYAGLYQVSVIAIDYDGRALAGLSSSILVRDDRLVDRLELEFSRYDF